MKKTNTMTGLRLILAVMALVSFAAAHSFAATPEASNVRELNFNFEAVKVGTAENMKGPTGCTVLYFPKGATGAVDIRGGAAAVRESSSINDSNAWAWVDAIVLAGGSTYGLEAADGVMKSLLEQRGNSVKFDDIPAVPAAIVYDFEGRNNSLYPDKELGAKAFKNAVTGKMKIGAIGAGVNVTVGKYFGSEEAEKSGQGAAFLQVGDLKILVVTVVNAVGNIVDENGKIIAGSYDRKTKTHFNIAERLLNSLQLKEKKPDAKGNTTISAVVTNVKLDRSELQRLAMTVHTSMAGSIQPFQTPFDGDTLFALSTNTQEKTEGLSISKIGVLSSALMRKAILGIFQH